MSRRGDLPFGSEFSLSQIELPKVLEFAALHGGDWCAFKETIRKETIREAYFEANKTSAYNRATLADTAVVEQLIALRMD